MNTAITKKSQIFTRSELTKKALPIVLSAALSVFLFINPSSSSIAVKNSLNICVTRLIPALFPFLCISGVLVRSGFGDVCAGIFGRGFELATGLPKEGAASYILGIFCGFPVGGKTACDICRVPEKTTALAVLCNNSGLGFVVCGIGAGLWGSQMLGVSLFAANTVSAFLTVKLVFPKKERRSKSQISAPAIEKGVNFSVMDAISDSLSEASVSMLKICGYVTFFTLVCECIGNTLTFIPQSGFVKIICASLLEITTACASANEFFAKGYSSVVFCKAATFFAVGFGGLSSAMQLFSFTKKADPRRYLSAKLVQGLLCVVLYILFEFSAAFFRAL